jgi:hypothetical protein
LTPGQACRSHNECNGDISTVIGFRSLVPSH